jgi:hypothetical protein
MTTTSTPTRPASGYARRPVVVLSLDELHGPGEGVITVPRHLYWSGTSELDLADEPRVAVVYSAILDAARPGDITEWVSPQLLTQVWPYIALHRRKRAAWEAANPQLAAAALAVPAAPAAA